MKTRNWLQTNRLVLIVLLLAACGPAPTPEVIKETVVIEKEVEVTRIVEPTPVVETVVVTATPEPAEAAERVKVRWYVGLGTGSNPDQIDPQKKVVEAFNASQDRIELEIEIVPDELSEETLKTEIAAGNAPDIVGPVGMSGSNHFAGLWLDLTPLFEKHGFDTTQFDPGAVDFWNVAGEGQVGLQIASYPQALVYNKDLFDEAGLPYPPHEFGADYEGKPWDLNALEELAMKLTVDANGNDATSPDFDPENIVQFGFSLQWNDWRGEMTYFGADSVVDENGNARIPERWREGTKWVYAAMWDKHFMPTKAYDDSDLLAAGNPFSSGNVAMTPLHLWFPVCCIGDKVKNWDAAANPSVNGVITSKLHADTFRILNTTKHPDEAFEALMYLFGPAYPDLLQIYGGMPARKDQVEPYFKKLDEKFPQGVDWQVFINGFAYKDDPNHESNMPNFTKAWDLLNTFQVRYHSTSGLDIETEMDTLLQDLQQVFDEAK